MPFHFCWKASFLAADIGVHASKQVGMTPQICSVANSTTLRERFDLQRREQEASFGLLHSLMLSNEDSSADPVGDH